MSNPKLAYKPGLVGLECPDGGSLVTRDGRLLNAEAVGGKLFIFMAWSDALLLRASTNAPPWVTDPRNDDVWAEAARLNVRPAA